MRRAARRHRHALAIGFAHVAMLTGPALARAVATRRPDAIVRPEAALVVATMLIFGALESRALRGTDTARPGAPGFGAALASGLGLFATAALAIGWPTEARAHGWLGAALVTAGIALRVAAVRRLGVRFSSETVLVPGETLASRGVYRLRHPSDIGLALVAAGLAALGGSAAALVGASVVAISIVVRVLQEERVLAPARRRAGRVPADDAVEGSSHSSFSVPNAEGT